MREIKYNRKFFLELRDSFIRSDLYPRIVCLIAHGSSLFKRIEEDDNSDVDVELVLSKPRRGDYFAIKSIVGQTETAVECQLRYFDEIKRKISLIRKSNYKLFMYFAYSNGFCLIGNNVYRRLANDLSIKDVKKSLMISAQIAFKDVRKTFFAGKDNYFVNKNILRTIELVCMVEGFFDYRDLGTKKFFDFEKKAFIRVLLASDKYKKGLSSEEIETLERFSVRLKTGTISKEMFLVIKKIVSILEFGV